MYMWVPMDVLGTVCLSWGASLLALWAGGLDDQATKPRCFIFRGSVVVALVSGCYALGRIIRCYSAFFGI